MKAASRDQIGEIFRASYLLNDDDLCVNTRARSVICTACEKACSLRAIKASVDAVELNETDCTTCGACVPVCPAGALRLSVFDPARFLEAAAAQSELHVHCSESRDGGGGIVIPCHLMIDERLAAVATKGGTRDLILHARPQCHECSRADAKAHIADLGKSLKRWFGDSSRQVRWARMGETAEAKKAERLDQAIANRRNFLRLAGARAMSNISWLVPSASDPMGMPEPQGIFVPGEFRHKPDAYQNALAGAGQDFDWKEGALLPFVARSISQACTHCGICAERCPTGALGIVHGPGWMGIDYDIPVCTNCGLCTAICPVSAIKAEPVRSWNDAQHARHLQTKYELAKCERCGQPFRAYEQGETQCQACGNEADVDQAWMAMLGG
jgi:ferredoxin